MSDMMTILIGDAREQLATLPDQSVQCIVTSPPYLGLRHYLKTGDPLQNKEIGTEPSVKDYIAALLPVFDEARRVLRDDGLMWLNLGDSYSASGKGGGGGRPSKQATNAGTIGTRPGRYTETAPKNLLGVPWRVAFALQDAGWHLRSAVVWRKTNGFVESVIDRPTKSYEMIFMFAKNVSKSLLWRARDTLEWSEKPDLKEHIPRSAIHFAMLEDERMSGEEDEQLAFDFIEKHGAPMRPDDRDAPVNRWRGYDYFFDALPISQPLKESSVVRARGGVSERNKFLDMGNDTAHRSLTAPRMGGRKHLETPGQTPHGIHQDDFRTRSGNPWKPGQLANPRDVWDMPVGTYKGKHYATFPEELPRRCILCSTRPDNIVLDMFAGSGTTASVAIKLGRHTIAIDLDERNRRLIQKRCETTVGMGI